MSQEILAVVLLVLFLGQNFVESQYVNATQYPGSLCDRPCVQNQKRICYFEWVLEYYHAMGPACGNCPQVEADCYKPQCIIADGIQKGVMSINRQIPGPPIYVCEGDKVIVDIVNMAQGTGGAIHWHGLHMLETPYMDGLPFVTQCPFLYDTTFRYSFYATQPGTQFYHSHAGQHKLNGQYGALIIRKQKNLTPNIGEYDYDLSENYILISDWRHDYAENSFPGLPKGVSFPESFLINGRGTYIDKNTMRHTIVPVTKYLIRQKGRHRFRLIHSGSLTCGVQVQIEKHSMVIIATDSYDVEPYEIDTLVVNAGERYDFVIDARMPKGDYWIRVRGLESCQTQPTDTFALLRYVIQESDVNKPQPAFPAYTSTYPIGSRLNHPTATCFDNDSESCVADLTALEGDYDLITRTPDYSFKFPFFNYVIPVAQGFIPGKYVRFDNPIDDVIAAGVVNNISLTFPPVPLLTQYSQVDQNDICDQNRWPSYCKGAAYCPCTHIVKVRKNSIVEMAIIDQANVPDLFHPFHLHGYRFAVMGTEQQSSNLKQSIESAKRFKKYKPVWKDTVSVPTNGLAVVRFRANNPGFWMLHCHYQLHLLTGMALVFQVGEPNEMVQAPIGFPKCGNYKPDVKQIGY